MHSDVMSRQSHTEHENKNKTLSFLSETAALAAAVLQISIRLFLFGSLGGTQQYVATCLCIVYAFSYLFLRCLKYRSYLILCTHKIIVVRSILMQMDWQSVENVPFSSFA